MKLCEHLLQKALRGGRLLQVLFSSTAFLFQNIDIANICFAHLPQCVVSTSNVVATQKDTFRNFQKLQCLIWEKTEKSPQIVFLLFKSLPGNKCPDLCLPLYSYFNFEFCEHIQHHLWGISEMTRLYSESWAEANIKGYKSVWNGVCSFS